MTDDGDERLQTRRVIKYAPTLTNSRDTGFILSRHAAKLAENEEIQSLSLSAVPAFYSTLLMLRSLAFISCYLRSQK